MKRLVLAVLLTLPTLCLAVAPPDRTQLAVRRGLWRLEQGASNYITHRQCFSCHHQSLSIAALRTGREKGFSVSEKMLKEQVDFTLLSFRGKLDRVRKGQAVPGGNTMAAYALFTLQLGGHKPDETTDALVDYLLVRRQKDGSWPAIMPRPPSEGSRFTNAANALRGLKHYGLIETVKGERRKQIESAFEKGKGWVERAKPVDMEDRVFQLVAMVIAESPASLIRKAQSALEEMQNEDGSWSQLPDREGDVYATATALFALRQAGVKRTAAVYRRGIGYLLETQRPDGGWIVQTRSRPVQTFFDNGDPGGKSQFISFLATGWATWALLDFQIES